MGPYTRAQARDSARYIVSTIRHEVGNSDTTPLGASIVELLEAFDKMIDVSEAQDEEIDNLRDKIGRA